jgi:hypothetical protein
MTPKLIAVTLLILTLASAPAEAEGRVGGDQNSLIVINELSTPP